MMDLSLVPYAGAVGEPAGESYRECMRNHAAAIGGQAYDGCGEFMPGGEIGSLEALKCAACGCHRNFHRRHLISDHKMHHHPHHHHRQQPKPIFPPPPGATAAFFPPISYQPPRIPVAPAPATMIAAERSRVGSETPPRREEGMDGGDGSGSRSSAAMRKRNRTKFTAEQKEKMQAFAERMGWRIPRQDDVALREFCHEVGVERHVLKVWMHNNKSHLSSSSTSPASVVAGDGLVNPESVTAALPAPSPAAISV